MSVAKMSGLALATSGFLAAGLVLLGQNSGRGALPDDGKPPGPVPKRAGPTDPAVKALIEERIKTSREIYQQQMVRLAETHQSAPFDEIASWSRRWMEDQLRLGPPPVEKLGAIREHVERTRSLAKLAADYARTGQGRLEDALKVKYLLIEAEQMLVEASAAHPGIVLPAIKPEPARPDPAPPPSPPSP